MVSVVWYLLALWASVVPGELGACRYWSICHPGSVLGVCDQKCWFADVIRECLYIIVHFIQSFTCIIVNSHFYIEGDSSKLKQTFIA
jgi:hypothetical protein